MRALSLAVLKRVADSEPRPNRTGGASRSASWRPRRRLARFAGRATAPRTTRYRTESRKGASTRVALTNESTTSHPSVHCAPLGLAPVSGAQVLHHTGRKDRRLVASAYSRVQLTLLHGCHRQAPPAELGPRFGCRRRRTRAQLLRTVIDAAAIKTSAGCDLTVHLPAAVLVRGRHSARRARIKFFLGDAADRQAGAQERLEAATGALGAPSYTRQC